MERENDKMRKIKVRPTDTNSKAFLLNIFHKINKIIAQIK